MDIQFDGKKNIKQNQNKNKKRGEKGLKWLYILDDPKHVYNDLFGIHKY